MAKIKSYTTIEQSRKLSEILPLESADMEYLLYAENGLLVGNVPFVKDDFEVENSAYSHTYDRIACWSLASLFGVLPKNLNIGRPSLESNYKGYYWIQYYDEFMKPNDYKTECFNNPIDACYEMIIRLNELNLL